MTKHRRSLAWRMNRALESAGARRPLLARSGPAWVFGILGITAEAVLAPVVLAITAVLGVTSYLMLDAPWTRVRAQQRPRFLSVRILYLNALILVGFWLAVMFVFSAADPDVSNGVQSRLPAVLEAATARDLRSLIAIKRATAVKMAQPPAATSAASTWFEVFLHGIVASVALNFLLYGIVAARRRQRSRRSGRAAPRRALRYDSLVGLFVDEDSSSAG